MNIEQVVESFQANVPSFMGSADIDIPTSPDLAETQPNTELASRMLRARRIREMFTLGGRGVHDLGWMSGVPVMRTVKGSDLISLNEPVEGGDVYATFVQFQEGVDDRFGIPNQDGWEPDETVGAMEASVIRNLNPKGPQWLLTRNFLKGTKLTSVLGMHRRLVQGAYDFPSYVPEDLRVRIIEGTGLEQEIVASTCNRLFQEISWLENTEMLQASGQHT